MPPHWADDPTEEAKYPALGIVGTSMWEPTCEPDPWCALEDAVKWSGPGEEGTVLTTSGRYPLYKENGGEQEL